GLVQDTNGILYGTTLEGGAYGTFGTTPTGGTVFSLSVGARPFVETQSSAGSVGSAVKILGTNLGGATSVTLKGTPAAFTINAAGTAIAAIVPAGATSGLVQVVTPQETLTSNIGFLVTP